MIQHDVDTEASTYHGTLASFIFRNDEKFPQKIITRTFFCEEKY
jgi:hypothetical protein